MGNVCYMAHNSYKINDVEKMFFRASTSIHTAKNDFWTISMKCLPMSEGSSSAMPYHFTHYLWETCADKKYVKMSV